MNVEERWAQEGFATRLDQDRRRLAQDQASRPEASWLDVHLRSGGLQPGSVAESHARSCLRGASRSLQADSSDSAGQKLWFKTRK
jgi:hypothetical protein